MSIVDRVASDGRNECAEGIRAAFQLADLLPRGGLGEGPPIMAPAKWPAPCTRHGSQGSTFHRASPVAWATDWAAPAEFASVNPLVAVQLARSTSNRCRSIRGALTDLLASDTPKRDLSCGPAVWHWSNPESRQILDARGAARCHGRDPGIRVGPVTRDLDLTRGFPDAIGGRMAHPSQHVR